MGCTSHQGLYLRLLFMKTTVFDRISKEHLLSLFTLIGGTSVIAGSFLPWISFFGGLNSYSGVTGLYGKIFVVGGVLSITAAILFYLHPRKSLRWLIGLLGFMLLGFAGFVLIGLVRTFQQLASDPLMIARVGPGLFLILIGTLLIFGTLFLGELKRNKP